MANREPTSAVHEAQLVETFCSLASIDSPSGEEEAISVVVAQRLRDLGCAVTTDAKHNVIGRLFGPAADRADHPQCPPRHRGAGPRRPAAARKTA